MSKAIEFLRELLFAPKYHAALQACEAAKRPVQDAINESQASIRAAQHKAAEVRFLKDVLSR